MCVDTKTMVWLHAIGMTLLFACVISLANELSNVKQQNVVLASQIEQNKANVDGVVEILGTNSKTWKEQHAVNQAADLRLSKLEAR